MAESDVKSSLGQRLLAFREERGLSLRTLAEKSGLSASFLSQVERDEASPSIASLDKITQALGIDVAELFAQPAPDPLVRAAERVRLESAWSKGHVEVMSRVRGSLRPRMLTLQPHGGTGLFPASAREMFVFVHWGEFVAQLGRSEVSLAAGDSLHVLQEHGLVELRNVSHHMSMALLVVVD